MASHHTFTLHAFIAVHNNLVRMCARLCAQQHSPHVKHEAEPLRVRKYTLSQRELLRLQLDDALLDGVLDPKPPYQHPLLLPLHGPSPNIARLLQEEPNLVAP